MKHKLQIIICIVLAAAIIGIVFWGINRENQADKAYEDGLEQVDLDRVQLVDSKVDIDFAEVILGQHEEMRKLIVSTQKATVSMELSSSLIKNLDWDFIKKTQKISYTGTGYFVVDLDNLTDENIIQDKERKTLTIKIDHAYLQAIEIDPEKIIIGEKEGGFLAWGEIKLTLEDYNVIEKELRSRLENKFDTVANGQYADAVARKMVKEVYEPVIKAINPKYTVDVEFE